MNCYDLLRVDTRGQCQTISADSTQIAARSASGKKLTPLGECDGAIDFEILAAVDVALLIEVVVN